MNIDAHCACALSHEGDFLRISAERSDIVNHPLNGRCLVKQSVVSANAATIRKIRMGTKAVRPETVIHRHRDDALFGEAFTVDISLVGASAREASAVNKNQNRAVFRLFRCPYIQEKAVFTVGKRKPFAKLLMIKRIDLFVRLKGTVLITTVFKNRCVINALPRSLLFRVFVPSGSCVAHRAKFKTGFFFNAPDYAAGRFFFNIIHY